MKTLVAATAVVVTLSLTVVSDASAQVVVSRSWTPAPVIGGPVYSSSVYVAPYSYYVTLPRPARGYVPYGPGDAFPFYGRAYGHPYDPWTWPYMGGGYSRYLARYYYPPVP
jgi:hypothetical protein